MAIDLTDCKARLDELLADRRCVAGGPVPELRALVGAFADFISEPVTVEDAEIGIDAVHVTYRAAREDEGRPGIGELSLARDVSVQTEDDSVSGYVNVGLDVSITGVDGRDSFEFYTDDEPMLPSEQARSFAAQALNFATDKLAHGVVSHWQLTSDEQIERTEDTPLAPEPTQSLDIDGSAPVGLMEAERAMRQILAAHGCRPKTATPPLRQLFAAYSEFCSLPLTLPSATLDDATSVDFQVITQAFRSSGFGHLRVTRDLGISSDDFTITGSASFEIYVGLHGVDHVEPFDAWVDHDPDLSSAGTQERIARELSQANDALVDCIVHEWSFTTEIDLD